MKKLLKFILSLVLVVVVVVAGYFAYVLISFHRYGDLKLEVKGESKYSTYVPYNTELSLLSYNIGFGAYEDDYGFFMDGGTESRAWSKDRLLTNMDKIIEYSNNVNADFNLYQEIDTNSTRSYHVNEMDLFVDKTPQKDYIFSINYDSPYLMYPILKPHGKSVAGIMTFSNYDIDKAYRKELPIENSLYKLLDLDRCYSKSYIKANYGRYLVIYNFHLSAYTSDGTIANEQLKVLLDDMDSEYKLGNITIAAGDFNKDILGDSSVYFGKSDIEYTWAQPIDMDIINASKQKLTAPIDINNPVPSCRNADGPYHEGQYVLTIDGFITSPNVNVKSAEVLDTKFKYSDHNPVKLVFELLNQD